MIPAADHALVASSFTAEVYSTERPESKMNAFALPIFMPVPTATGAMESGGADIKTMSDVKMDSSPAPAVSASANDLVSSRVGTPKRNRIRFQPKRMSPHLHLHFSFWNANLPVCLCFCAGGESAQQSIITLSGEWFVQVRYSEQRPSVLIIQSGPNEQSVDSGAVPIVHARPSKLQRCE